jgi:hypothetical protein
MKDFTCSIDSSINNREDQSQDKADVIRANAGEARGKTAGENTSSISSLNAK